MIPSYLPGILRTLSRRRLYNVFVALASLFISTLSRKPIVWGQPFVLTIEPTNHCDLRCPQCHTGSKRSSRQRGYLNIHHFEKILLECKDYLMYLLLFDQGEPLLHPQYHELVKLAKAYHFYVVCSTNGQRLTNIPLLYALVQSELDELIVSVDGLTDETYTYYRKGGDLNKVVQGIATLRAVRRTLRSDRPRIAVQFIVMRHNEAELPVLRATARRWGADRVYVKSAYISSPEEAEEYLPLAEKYRRYRVENDRLLRKGKNFGVCKRLWYSAVIHWNGAVVPCCFDRNDDYVLGSFSESLNKIWKNDAYKKFRNAFFHCRPTLCGNCTDGLKIYLS